MKRGLLQNVLGTVTLIALTFLAAGLGAYASIHAKSFYVSLDRPAWAPPGWLFGPAWTVLYCMMACAASLVWWRGTSERLRTALAFYLVQLGANALWTWIFFTWKMGLLAVLEIGLLWVLIVITGVLFYRIQKVAGLLLIPYLLWVSFATCLSYSVWSRNPGVL